MAHDHVTLPKTYALWLLLMLLATLTRFPYIDWDDDIAAHPDERYLISVAQDTPLFSNPSVTSEGYAYGQLPLTVAQLVHAMFPHEDPLFFLRYISALVGIMLVAVTIKLALMVGDVQTAVIAGVITTFAPLLLQHTHYYTVDLWATLFATMALFGALRHRWSLAGIAAGLALSCKVSMAWGVLPLACCALFDATSSRRWTWNLLWDNRDVWYFALITVGVFCVASPWMLLQPRLSWVGPFTQAAMVSGRYSVPYTMQYEHTMPYLYPLGQMALWGLGLLPTVFGVVTLLQSTFRFRQIRRRKRILVLYVLVYFIGVGGMFVKFPRYMLPLYPAWAVLAALSCKKRVSSTQRLSAQSIVTVLMILLQVMVGTAQLTLYRQPHPWITASEWIVETIPDTKVLAVEAWDHPLPVNTIGVFPYEQMMIPIDMPEGDAKMRQLRQISDSDAIIVFSSRRNFAAQCQHDCASETMLWYQSSFTERSMLTFTRCSEFLGIAITDDPIADAGLPVSATLAELCGTTYAIRLPKLDESFRVYDSPSVVILLPD